MKDCNHLTHSDLANLDGFAAGRRNFIKLAFGPEHASDPMLEYSVHAAVLRPFAAKIREKYAAIEIETYLMALDGSVEDAAAQS